MVRAREDNDALVFMDEPEALAEEGLPAWCILVVDDEPDVHQATLVALKYQTILGRRLDFLHAYSAAEARALIEQNDDISVILLDVVMETNDAGLQLVRYIRDELHNSSVRIVLRTGQPGYAPEIDTIRAYDINDYETKSELTRVRLFTSLTVALRSYCQIQNLEANRHGLEMVAMASNRLSRPQSLRRFAEGIVTQLCTLLQIKEEGLVCSVSSNSAASPYILAAAGKFSAWIGKSLTSIPDAGVREQIERVFRQRCNQFEGSTGLFVSTPDDGELAIFVELDRPLDEVERNLLEVFCSNLVIALENTQLYARISALAYEDALLKLPNRNSFLWHIEQRPDECDTLAILDIDGFADINSILDQSFGDCILQSVADRLNKAFHSPTVIARIGSDVFGLLGPSSEINPDRFSALFSPPFDAGGQSLRLSATSGFVQLQAEHRKAAELLKNASIALKNAKAFNRGGALFFDQRLANEARERMEMLSRLRLAFSTERLFLVYQPIVDLASGRILGAEALLRWRNDSGEYVPPSNFVPLAEQSGLMVAIGNWVLRDSFIFLRRLIDDGHRNFCIAVNVSLVQFREPDFVDRLATAIKDHGIGAYNIEIELTESVAIDNIELIRQKLVALQALGVSITIDGFGTGYSSLNILRQLSVDCLKIDRTFVCGAKESANDPGIAGMVLQLSGQLGLKTTAEGIENESQRRRLLGMGCRNGQGNYFSPPLSGEQLVELVASRQVLP